MAVSITIKGREIPLLYTTYEMKTIQEEIAPLGKAIQLVLGRNPDDEKDLSGYMGAEHLKHAATLIKILGNAGLEEAGEKPDLTEKWIMRALKPVEMIETISACLDTMKEGMASEIPEEKKTGPVDVTLEKIKKKDEKEN